MGFTWKQGPREAQPGRKVDTLSPKFSAQLFIHLWDPKGVDRALEEEEDLVDGPTVLCPAKSSAGDGSLTARHFRAVTPWSWGCWG